MRSWLPPDHLAWQVIEVTGQLDLAGFAAAYRADGQGQAPYDPAMMAGLLLYCYFKGIRSSRKIAAACIDDVGCLVICGGASPSHRAVAEFIRRHRPEIRRLFVQVLSLLAAEGAVAGHTAAVDGSPVSGNASRFANLDGDQLAGRIAAVEAAIDAEAEAWLAGADGADSQQPLWDDDGEDDEDPPPGGGVPRGGGAGRAAPGPPDGVGAAARAPGRRPAKRGGGGPGGWTRQVTAARRQILLAADLHDNPADAGALAAMIAAATANCELAGLAGRIRAWLAANGYAPAPSFPEPDHRLLLLRARGQPPQPGPAATS